MTSYWRATPRLARTAFLLAVLALAQFVGMWLMFLFNPEPGSNPLPGVLLWGTLTGIPFVVIVTLIAVGFRSTSAATARLASVGAAMMAVGGLLILLLVLTAPTAAQIGPAQYWIGATAGAVGILYAVVAYLGFRDAARKGGPASGSTLPGKVSGAG